MEKMENLLFGAHPVLEALKSGQSIDKVMVSNSLKTPIAKEIIALSRDRGISLNRVPGDKLNRITKKNHQGIIAFSSPISFHDIKDILPVLRARNVQPFILILDRISDVRNFGAIVRTAECAGVHAIIIPKKGAAQINAETVKTSAGAIFNIPICKVGGIETILPYLIDEGIKLVACTEKTDNIYTESKYDGPVGIIMGSEESGVAKSNINKCEVAVKIPLVGKTGSLNVSVAAGLIIYEVVRQRNL